MGTMITPVNLYEGIANKLGTAINVLSLTAPPFYRAGHGNATMANAFPVAISLGLPLLGFKLGQ